MKKIFTLVFCVFFFVVLTGAQSRSRAIRERYEKEIKNIPAWQKGESKKEYTIRYKREKERIYHKCYHSSYGRYYSDCEFCAAEMEEKQAQYLAELKEKEHKKAIADSIERRKLIVRDSLKTIRDSLKTIEKTKADSLLRVFFDDSYKAKKVGEVKKYHAKLDGFKHSYENIKNLRTAKIDALEKQYPGRLDGEIFKGKKSEINMLMYGEMSTLYETVRKEREKILLIRTGILEDLTKFLTDNGVSTHLLSAEYFNRIRFNFIENECTEYEKLLTSIKLRCNDYYAEHEKDAKYWLLNN